MKINSKRLKEIFAPVAAVADGTVRVDVNEGEMRFLAVDVAHIQCIYAKMPTDSKMNMVFYADAERFGNAVGDLDGDVEITHDKPWLTFTGENSLRSIKLVEPDLLIKVPSITSQYVRAVDQDFLSRIPKMSGINECIAIKIHRGRMILEASSDVETAIYSIITEDAEIESKYSSVLMSKIVKTIKTDEPVIMTIDDNYPLKLEWSKGDVSWTYIIAPRIEDV